MPHKILKRKTAKPETAAPSASDEESGDGMAAPAMAVQAPPLMDGPDEAELAKRRARERAAAHRARAKAENAASAAARAAGVNPLLDLSEERRAQLFAWLRECPYDDAVQQMLREEGLPGVSRPQLTEFFQREAEGHWEKRIERAALEANALVRLVEENPVRFSSGILAALGQEAFRQIASGQVAPDAMNKMASLFLKARADERADQMHALKQEKVRQELIGRVNLALEKLSEEVSRSPETRAIFEELQRELQGGLDEETSTGRHEADEGQEKTRD